MSYEQSKIKEKKRKEKIKLLNILSMQTNMELTFMDKESDEYVEKLKNLQEIRHKLFSLKRNKRQSSFYTWEPHVGLNRRMRRI